MSMNPDGFDLARPSDCASSSLLASEEEGYGNALGIDLDSNFPSIFDPVPNILQPETKVNSYFMEGDP